MTSQLEAMQAALAAEHAAIWAYGVIGTYAAATRRPAVSAAEQTHRVRRDQLETLIVAGSAIPNPGLAAYQLPSPVTDPTSAIVVAGQIEEGLTAVWRFALGNCDTSTTRVFALNALIDSSVQSLAWRQVIEGNAALLHPFPGQSA
ncbi:MAG: ferritin-like domain-containing protein [Antricoccus sp.]